MKYKVERVIKDCAEPKTNSYGNLTWAYSLKLVDEKGNPVVLDGTQVDQVYFWSSQKIDWNTTKEFDGTVEKKGTNPGYFALKLESQKNSFAKKNNYRNYSDAKAKVFASMWNSYCTISGIAKGEHAKETFKQASFELAEIVNDVMDKMKGNN